MLNRFILFVLSFGFCISSIAQVTITHIANMGIMISNDEHKIVIDGFFEGDDMFPHLSKAEQKRLINGKIPFDELDVILATHIHGDHFDAEMIRQSLSNNSDCIFLGNHEVMDQLLKLNEGTNQNVPSNVFNKGSLKIRLLDMPHVKSEGPAINSAVLVEMDGKLILHTGDGELNAANLTLHGFSKLGIDVLVTPYWNMRADKLELIDQLIKPRQILFAHIPELDREMVTQALSNVDLPAEVHLEYMEELMVD